ncbi:unnamed protein product [Ilex paraguariensis]|uniref:FBD domain-containing protein n=1 Tax=Ilex paraguariensis TaxID=185542 RepID=A0ABC8UN06_9AQUA
MAAVGIPASLSHLKYLKLSEICFGLTMDVKFALFLIRNSPNLQKITIEAFVSTEAVKGSVLGFYDTLSNTKVSCFRLREVVMRCMTGTLPELMFVKFLLATLPMLEKMLIEPNPAKVNDRGLEILKEVIRFRRASSCAEIMFKDFY